MKVKKHKASGCFDPVQVSIEDIHVQVVLSLDYAFSLIILNVAWHRQTNIIYQFKKKNIGKEKYTFSILSRTIVYIHYY